MVSVLVDTFEEISSECCSKFILDKVMERSTSTTKLIKLNVLDKNIQKVSVDLGFELKGEIKSFKKEGTIKETKLLDFYQNIKKFLSSLCNHLLTKTHLQSQFTICCYCFNLCFMTDYQSSCKKIFKKISKN